VKNWKLANEKALDANLFELKGELEVEKEQ
jgi:hypothetical protein